MKYVVYRIADGEIVSVGDAPTPKPGHPSILEAPIAEGLARLVNPNDATPETHRVIEEAIVPLPEDVAARRKARPPHPARWDWGALDWVDERTPEQLAAHLSTVILYQINALERRQLRSMRELTLGRGNQGQARQRLEELDDQITALRAQLP